jgi:hypothetical protein
MNIEADNHEADDDSVIMIQNEGSENTTSQHKTTPVFKWKKKELEAVDVSFSGANFLCLVM